MRLLLSAPHGAVRADDEDGWYLVLAARHGCLAVARLLLKWPVNAPRADGWNSDALQEAAAHGHLEMVKMLLGWPVHAPRADCGGKHGAVLHAAAKGHLDVVRLLLEWPTNASPANCDDGKVCVLANRVLRACCTEVRHLLQSTDKVPASAPDSSFATPLSLLLTL